MVLLVNYKNLFVSVLGKIASNSITEFSRSGCPASGRCSYNLILELSVWWVRLIGLFLFLILISSSRDVINNYTLKVLGVKMFFFFFKWGFNNFNCGKWEKGLSLEPLIGALAAGNCVFLKTSEYSPASSAFLAKAIGNYVDNKAVRVVEGGPATGERLLQQRWEKIFFTGGSN